jgi:predicted acetyltransferase
MMRVKLEMQELRDGDMELEFVGASPAEDHVPELLTFHFKILRCGQPAGSVRFRNGSNPDIDLYAGNLGCTVAFAQRGHGLAERACRLLIPFMRQCGFEQIWITCDPANDASRRTCEKLGARLVETVDLPPGHEMYLDGERQKLRYLFKV